MEGDQFAIAKVLRAGRTKVVHESNFVALPVVNDIRFTLNRPGNGNLYTTEFFTRNGKVHPIGTRTPHRASQPFRPPAIDSGELVRSIYYKTRRNPQGAEVEIGSTAEHAVYTEFGTSKMEPRPWFRPAMLKWRVRMVKPWIDGIERHERAEARRLGGKG